MNLKDWLFPKRCVGCNQVGKYICAHCLNHFKPPTKQICPMCESGSIWGQVHSKCRRPQGLDGLVIGFAYKGVVKRLVGKIKYKGVYDMIQELIDIWVSLADFDPLSRNSWIIVPVPMHPKKQRQRGFNQATLLGQALSVYFGWQFSPCLIRTRNTRTQVGLTAHARHLNLKNAFQITHPHPLLHQNVLLVDDVWTTGTTLRECTKQLKKAGAKKVWGLVVAS